MDTNHVICRNRVVVEGKDIGHFESLNVQATSRTLGNSAVLTLPLYAIGSNGSYGRASRRFRQDLNIIKVCAEVQVYVWYDSWNAETLDFESYPEVLAFSGWVENISEGFPAKIYLQDNSFILRFGAVEKAWDETATVQKIMEDCIPIAQKAFDAERELLGFTRATTRLTYSVEKKNVQAETNKSNFNNWGGRSPHETMQRLMSELVLYGGVGNDFNVYLGAGVTKSTRPILSLNTMTNVISRDMVQVDGRFVDYDVKAFGILKSGRQYTATAGLSTSKSEAQRSEFEKAYVGETFRCHAPMNTIEGIKAYADKQLKSLQGERNKGTISLLLYPKAEIMDWVEYTDTVFEKLSGGYYVLSYAFTASDKGYFQTLQVTDKIFML